MLSDYIEGVEISAPSAPAANKGRIFFQDYGGKTQLAVRFNSGAVVDIAQEGFGLKNYPRPNRRRWSFSAYGDIDAALSTIGNAAGSTTTDATNPDMIQRSTNATTGQTAGWLTVTQYRAGRNVLFQAFARSDTTANVRY